MTLMMVEVEDLVSPQEIAERFELGPRTVYRYRSKPDFPSPLVTLSGVDIYDVREVETFIRRQRTAAETHIRAAERRNRA